MKHVPSWLRRIKVSPDQPKSYRIEYRSELKRIGVRSHLLKRDSRSARLKGLAAKGSMWPRWSTGLIWIPGAPAEFIDVLLESRGTALVSPSVAYLVSDQRLANRFNDFKVRVKLQRSIWFCIARSARVVGDDYGTGLTEFLTESSDWCSRAGDWEPITIQAHPEHNCWSISLKNYRLTPTREQFDAYQRLASVLLELDLSSPETEKAA